MQRSSFVGTALCILLAGCAAPIVPAAAAPSGGALDTPIPAIPALLGAREQLRLTPDQTESLEAIAREWAATDYELNRQLGTVRGNLLSVMTVALRPDAGSIRAALSENNRNAAHAVGQVLTPDQREAACEMRPARQPGGNRRHAASARRTARIMEGSVADPSLPPAPLWPWCGAPAPDPSPAAEYRRS